MKARLAAVAAPQVAASDYAKTTPKLRVVDTGMERRTAPNSVVDDQLLARILATDIPKRLCKIERKLEAVDHLDDRLSDQEVYTGQGLTWLKARGDVAAANIKALLKKVRALEERAAEIQIVIPEEPPKRRFGLSEAVLLLAASAILYLVAL